MTTLKLPVRGMHCKSCEILIEKSIKKIPCVTAVSVDYKKGQVVVGYHGQSSLVVELETAIREAGYEVGKKDMIEWVSRNKKDYIDLIKALFIVLLIYWVARSAGIFDLNPNNAGGGVLIALVVGLIAGVSTCMAIVGGLVLALSARHAELHPEATSLQKFRPHLYFNLGRIFGFTLLGGLVGLMGKAISLSGNLLGVMTIVVGVVMLFLGLKLIEIFPRLKNHTISLPASVAKLFGLHKDIKEYSVKNSLISGALTFFLPCGFTQAMQLFAMSSGSFIKGALIMFLFALGTAPGLLGIGGLSSIFKGQKARIFFMTAGIAVLAMGWLNIVNGSSLISFKGKAANIISEEANAQVVRMTQKSNGYSPSVLRVEKGRQVKWIITGTASFSCSSFLVMPSYNISKSLKKGENIIYFTPQETGEIPFSCSMGMYRGKFIVVDKLSDAINSVSNSDLIGSAGSCGSSANGCGGCGGVKKNIQPTTGNTDAGNTNVVSTLANQVQLLKTTYTFDRDIQPNSFIVKKGIPVRLEVTVMDNGLGCMSTIMIEGLYPKSTYLKKDNLIVMEFTPQEIGDYKITCAMGVARGQIRVAG